MGCIVACMGFYNAFIFIIMNKIKTKLKITQSKKRGAAIVCNKNQAFLGSQIKGGPICFVAAHIYQVKKFSHLSFR